ncbi:MAG: efflux RND transporter periplasmic adaptor subunit [Acidobacteriota bacterium]|jgi:membrane fusion protein (multidrug efflux system)
MRRRRRLWSTLGFVALLAGLIAAGFVFLRPAPTADAATAAAVETDTDDDDDAAAKPADGEEAAEEEEETRVPVSVTEVARGSVSTYVSATANLIAEDEVRVLAEAEGQLDQLLVEEGDMVERDQLLALLVRDDEQIQFDKAEVRASNAELAFDRTRRLAAEGLVAEEELETATMEHRVAQQELAEARWKLDQTEIRAPFAGRITARDVTVGKHIRVGDELFTVTNFEPLIARIYLPEKDVVGLAPDRPVRITLQADADVSFAGRIRQIAHVVDVATGTVKVTVEAVHPPRSVRPGGFVDIAITRQTKQDVVLVPRDAVIRELQRAHVFVKSDDGKAVRKDIELGLEEGDHIEVLSGLEGGEQVVIAGQGGLKDGMAVKVIEDPTRVARSSEAADRKNG